MKLTITIDYEFTPDAYGEDDGEVKTPMQAAEADEAFLNALPLEDFLEWLREKNVPYIYERQVRP
jgi:hypothetical protein